MKVLHVVDGMDPQKGGVSQAIRTMVAGLNELDIISEVLCLDGQETDFSTKDIFIIHKLGPGKTPWSYSPLIGPWLADNIKRFDFIIVHGIWLYHSYAVYNAIKNARRNTGSNSKLPKYFIMPHGMLDPYFQRASNRNLKALRNKIYWSLIEAKVINNADGLLFTCQEECLLARQPFRPYSPKKEIVIGLGVEKPPSFIEVMRESFFQQCPKVKDSNYLLFMGRIDEKKGVDLLINAYRNVYYNKLESFTSIPRLVIAGPGLEAQFGKEMQVLVAQTPGLDQYILFPGMLLGNTKWGAFYCCEAFILPSHQENFGIAIVEGLACGKPALISNQINIWREIDKSEAGFAMPDSEVGVTELLQAWQSVNNGKREIMQKNAIGCFIDYFTTAVASQQLRNALN